MRPIDLLAAVAVKRGPRRLRIFPGGWGDPAAIARLDDVSPFEAEPSAVSVEWEPTQQLEGRTIRDGRFEAVTEVPEAARTAAVRLIEPPGGTDRLCLSMAAWNDQASPHRW